jgi:hypothetical protein
MTSLQDIAQQDVTLVLALGAHDAGYVDAYYGPPAWRAEADAAPRPLADIDSLAAQLEQRLASLGLHGFPRSDVREAELLGLRRVYLTKHLAALRTRVALLGGKRMTFDEESQALYDGVATERIEAEFQDALDTLSRSVPGSGPLLDRYNAFRSRFVIPADAVPVVFEAALRACRERTVAAMALPAGEQCALEFVLGRSWSGYNWYHGGYRSVIQVNTDLPIHIDRAVELAAHEGYPGHHAHNVRIEDELVRKRGWVEFTVYPLYSPQSLVAEGIANCASGMVFSPSERLAFERDVLSPGGPRPGHGHAVRGGHAGRREADARRDGSGAAAVRRTAGRCGRRGVARVARAALAATRGAARALHPAVSQLRHQLHAGPRAGRRLSDAQGR